MPVNSVHPSYKHYSEAVEDCRNAFEGSRAIKKAGDRYLPRLSGQQNVDYESYKGRALFFSITGKTVSALVGMTMSRPPQIQHTERMNPYFKERQGAEFLEICSTTMQEVLLMGGYGYFLDAPEVGGDPKICRYPRESILNWSINRYTGALTMVVLAEEVEVQKTADEYEVEIQTMYRELWLDSSGVFNVTTYNQELQELRTIQPTVKGRMLSFIPFYYFNPLGVGFVQMKPPMIDIVDLNISHYRSSADLEHGRHFTGLPTPVVTGVDSGTLQIGSTTAWVLPNPEATATFLEFTGQGLQSLEKAMVEKQSQMASMSARLIDNSKRGSEAEGTVRLRYMSETSSLITIVRAVEDGLNLVYGQIADFLDEPAPVIQMNKEFMDTKLSATELTALVNAYIEGTMSKETFIYNLRKGDVISPKQTDAAEAAAMREPPPPPQPNQPTNRSLQ